MIDEEVKKLIQEQYERAKTILTNHKDGHNQLAQVLIEREVIFADDVEEIFGKRPWKSRSDEIIAENERIALEEQVANLEAEKKLLEEKKAEQESGENNADPSSEGNKSEKLPSEETNTEETNKES